MIGIICALEEEAEAVCAYMQDKQIKKIEDMEFYLGKIHHHDVVVGLSGVGKVNAAIATTILLTTYAIDQVINVGIAGGLLENQNTLDIVIANHVIQHDFDTSAIDGDEGIGIRYSCDTKLIEASIEALKKIGATYHIGDIASGDCFITINKRYDFIRNTFPSCVCAEMEAGAISQVASRFSTPCLIIRSLSDVACKTDSHLDFHTFLNKASVAAAKLTNNLLRMI